MRVSSSGNKMKEGIVPLHQLAVGIITTSALRLPLLQGQEVVW